MKTIKNPFSLFFNSLTNEIEFRHKRKHSQTMNILFSLLFILLNDLSHRFNLLLKDNFRVLDCSITSIITEKEFDYRDNRTISCYSVTSMGLISSVLILTNLKLLCPIFIIWIDLIITRHMKKQRRRSIEYVQCVSMTKNRHNSIPNAHLRVNMSSEMYVIIVSFNSSTIRTDR